MKPKEAFSIEAWAEAVEKLAAALGQYSSVPSSPSQEVSLPREDEETKEPKVEQASSLTLSLKDDEEKKEKAGEYVSSSISSSSLTEEELSAATRVARCSPDDPEGIVRGFSHSSSFPGGRKEEGGVGEEENRGRRRTLVATKALFPGMPPARVPRFRALPPEKWSVNDFVSYLLAEMTARHITPTVPRNGMAAHLKRLLQAADAKFGPEGGRRALKQLIDVCLGRPGFSGTGYLLREAEAFWSGQFTGLYRAPKGDVAEDW